MFDQFNQHTSGPAYKHTHTQTNTHKKHSRISCHKLLTTIWFVSGAGVGKLNAMLIDAPASAHGWMTLRGLVEALNITFWCIIAHEIATQATSYSCTRSVGLFEATAPLSRFQSAVLIQIADVNEGLDALFVLSKAQTLSKLLRDPF